MVFHFFFNATATTEIYTLSLHDALPILVTYLKDACDRGPIPSETVRGYRGGYLPRERREIEGKLRDGEITPRSEEHTSELQSHVNLVCRLLLEKKKKYTQHDIIKNVAFD